MRAGSSRGTGPSKPDPRPPRGNPDHDPFAALLQPPPNETEEQRAERLRKEEEARKRSENIDRMLRHDEKARRRKKTVKVLLLGQSESGKSTTLKREYSFPAHPLLMSLACGHPSPSHAPRTPLGILRHVRCVFQGTVCPHTRTGGVLYKVPADGSHCLRSPGTPEVSAPACGMIR